MYTEDEIQEVLNDLNEMNVDRSDKLIDLSDINTAYVASTIELEVLKDKNYSVVFAKMCSRKMKNYTDHLRVKIIPVLHVKAHMKYVYQQTIS